MNNLSQPPPSPSASNEALIDQLFESNERFRTKSALEELRNHCKTTEALKSFELFEGQLLKKLGISMQSLRRTNAPPPWPVEGAGLRTSRTMPLSTSASRSLCPSSSPVSHISNVDAYASKSKALYGHGKLTKSKTTGNLSTFMPTIPKRRNFLPAGPAQVKDPAPTAHRRKGSYFDFLPGSRSKASKRQEESTHVGRSEGERNSDLQAFSSRGAQQRETHQSNIAPKRSPASPDYAKVAAGDMIVNDLSAAALESGHGASPRLQGQHTASSRVELVQVSSGGMEKVIKSRRKAERQFSGDRVKNLLGAGVREVRRMGHRVSGMSWPGSGEE
jgi:hypothetical protein